jgi:hypothetical protein
MSDEEQQEGTPISVHDKDHPSLAATREAQDVASLDRIVVPPGAYTDPNNPAAAAGSVNMSVYTHPADLPEDYGESVEPGEVDVRSVIDEGAADQAQAVVTGLGKGTPGGKAADRPEDREEWTKADWVAQASEYGLPKSGNMDTVKERVEDYEGAVEEAKDYTATEWQSQIEETSDMNELADLRRLYTAAGASYVTVDSSFDDKEAAFSGSDDE